MIAKPNETFIINNIRQFLIYTHERPLPLLYTIMFTLLAAVSISIGHMSEDILDNKSDIERFHNSIKHIQERAKINPGKIPEEPVLIGNTNVPISEILRQTIEKAKNEGVDFLPIDEYVNYTEPFYTCYFGEFKRVKGNFILENTAKINLSGEEIIMVRSTVIEILPFFIVGGCAIFSVVLYFFLVTLLVEESHKTVKRNNIK